MGTQKSTHAALQISIKDLKAFFFPIECMTSYAHFLFFCKAYTGLFWSRKELKGGKNNQIILAHGDRHYFELYWKLHVLRLKFLPLYHPQDIWEEANDMILGTEPNQANLTG